MSEWIKFKFTSVEPAKIKVKFNDEPVENISEYSIDDTKSIWLEIPYDITEDNKWVLIGFHYNKPVTLETIQLCGYDIPITDRRIDSYIEMGENYIDFYLPCPFIDWWETTFN